MKKATIILVGVMWICALGLCMEKAFAESCHTTCHENSFSNTTECTTTCY